MKLIGLDADTKRIGVVKAPIKLIGLDVGTKRIGVAKANSDTKIAVPVKTITVDGAEIDQILQIAATLGTKHFVIGLPRSLQGTETAQSAYSRDFAKHLKQALPEAKIYFQDESLTSVEAKDRFKTNKKSFAKGEIDTEAATIILQDFLEQITQRLDEPELPLDNIDPTPEEPRLEIKKSPSFPRIFISILIYLASALTMIIIACLFWYFSALKPVQPAQPAEDSQTAFIIEDGASVREIASQLQSSDLIKSALTFRLYIQINGAGAQLKSGEYLLSKNLSVSEIVDKFIAGSVDKNVFNFTILPGETIMQVKQKMLKHGFSQETIDVAFTKTYDYPVLADKPADASLEGYLFGETYEFFNTATPEDIISTFIKGLDAKATKHDLKAQFAVHGLNMHEGIILASIVQKEAKSTDQPAVAQVFYNRLAAGKHLGSDVTVSYALDLIDPDRKTYTNNTAALAIDSCYNTTEKYGHAGLPCGPISSPGLSALLAVAQPSDNSYLYFLTGDDGKMYYGRTYSEHQSNMKHCPTRCSIPL